MAVFEGTADLYFSAVRSTGSTLLGIGDYFRNGAATSAPRPAAQPVPAPAVSSRPGCGGKQTLIAEVRWATKCVESHYSFHSCEGICSVSTDVSRTSYC